MKMLRFAVAAISVVAVFIPVIGVTTDAEIGPASAIYPDPLAIRSPTVTFGTCRVAVLPDEMHSASRIDRAKVSPLVVRVARNGGLGQGFDGQK